MAAAVLLALPATAAAQTPTRFDDPVPDGCQPADCSLREAILDSAPDAVITVPEGDYELAQGALVLTGARLLQGEGARVVEISAQNASRVVRVLEGGAPRVSGVTIADGDADADPEDVAPGLGGGVYVPAGAALTLTESTVEENGATVGGAIYSAGTLAVERSTIAFNTAQGSGARGGGLSIADGEATLIATTVSGNLSEETGGGLHTRGNVTLENVTIARNDALVTQDPSGSSGAGILQEFDEPGSDRTIASGTLVVQNYGGNCLGTTGDDGLIHARNSMADDVLCNVPQDAASNNLPITEAEIGELADNGGPTDTHALFPDSPAIDHARDDCETTDQRGLAAPQGPACDAGAYEAGASLTVTTTADDDGACTPEPAGCSLREAIALAAFDGEVSVPPGEYRLSRALEVQHGVTIAGAGARTTKLVGSGSDRVLAILEGLAFVDGVSVTGGDITVGQPTFGAVGGGIYVAFDAELELTASTVAGNRARRGGGIYNAGFLGLYESTVSDNRAEDIEIGAGGGVMVSDFGGAAIVNSTISGNSATRVGGGVASIGGFVALSSVTIAGNSAQTAGGGFYAQQLSFDGVPFGETDAINTLIAENAGGACSGAGPFQSFNVLDDDASCPGATTVSPVGLAGLADNGGPTDTRALLDGSPAVDAGTGCEPFDQRGVSRPQGAACDIGAFEGGAPTPPPPSGGGNQGQQSSPPPPPPSQPEPQLPSPEAGESLNAEPKSGTVKIKVPGSNRFVELGEGEQIPVGTVVDTRKGRVTLVAAANKSGGTATADFYAGIFKVGQTGGSKPITTLTLTEKLSCPKSGKANVAAKKKKKRRLWGDGKGRFRTKGSYSSATVRGTKWLTEDSCTSTLTRVTKGSVTVRDLVKRKNVVVKAGKKYVARRRA